MKTLRSFALVLALLFSFCAPIGFANASVSFSVFYSDLAPHGNWQVSAQYGQVWQPREYRAGWNPYYDGHWIFTDLGWTWVSDYDWGAVPYHYGTWVDDAHLGWVWVPGYTWAPAWVVFSQGPDYIGWAPVPPGFSVGVSVGRRDFDTNNFVFVASRDFDRPHIRSYAVPRASAPTIFNQTTIVNNIRVENNIVVNHGPDVAAVERASGRTIRPTRIEQVSRVAPTDHVTRDDMRVDRTRERQGFRAAEPNMEPPPHPRPQYETQNRREDRPAQPYQQHGAVPQPRVQYEQHEQRPQQQPPRPHHQQQPQPQQQHWQQPQHQAQPQHAQQQPQHQAQPRPEHQPQPHPQPQQQQQQQQQPPKPKQQPQHNDGGKHDNEKPNAESGAK